MLDIKYIRDNPKKIEQATRSKGFNVDVKKILALDEEVRLLKREFESSQAEKNKANKEIQQGQDKKEIVARMKKIDATTEKVTKHLATKEDVLKKQLSSLPNIPLPDVKIGKDESGNEVLKTVGTPTEFAFSPKDHLEIGERLEIIDTKTAAKVSGSRFGYLKNEAALLEFALIQYSFKVLMEKGFAPVVPPQLIKDEMMEGLGYLGGQGEQERYHFEKDGMYFIGTAEHSLIPMHANEIIDEKTLPMRYVGFSTCFRREAGTYGKDTRGIFRVHQFDKVEMVSFTKPEDGDKEFDLLVMCAEGLIKSLGIPYRVVQICTGDLAFPSAKTYDIEAWLPSENRYREIASISTCTDFQSRRLHIRYRTNKGNQLVHTLNGTAFAIGRTLIALLENFQEKDGPVRVPTVLRPYCGFDIVKRK